MIAHSKKRIACFCGTCRTPMAQCDYEFWGECRSCRLKALRTRKAVGNVNEAVENAETKYNGPTNGGEW